MDRSLEDKYYQFSQILYHFLEDTYLESNKREDVKTIQRFCNNRSIERLKQTIQEGKEVLRLNPFPWEWIADICNYFPFNDSKNDSESGYKEWVKWIVDEIEKEVKNIQIKNPDENEGNNDGEGGYGE